MDLPSWAMTTFVSVSGTCLMATAIFTIGLQGECGALGFDLPEDQAGVRAAETERVVQSVGDVAAARFIRNVVEIELGVALREVDRRRDDAVPDHQRRDPCLEASGGA